MKRNSETPRVRISNLSARVQYALDGFHLVRIDGKTETKIALVIHDGHRWKHNLIPTDQFLTRLEAATAAAILDYRIDEDGNVVEENMLEAIL